jgi:hypothetical protein
VEILELTFKTFLNQASNTGFYEFGYEDVVELLKNHINENEIEEFYAKNIFLDKPITEVELYLFETHNFKVVSFHDDFRVKLKTIFYSQIKSIELTMKLRESSMLVIKLTNGEDEIVFDAAKDGKGRLAFNQSIERIYKFLS